MALILSPNAGRAPIDPPAVSREEKRYSTAWISDLQHGPANVLQQFWGAFEERRRRPPEHQSLDAAAAEKSNGNNFVSAGGGTTVKAVTIGRPPVN